jgi:aspartate oxidase
MSSTTREKEVINLVMRQTDYTEEEAIDRLKKWNNNYINVIKEYLNPNFDQPTQKSKPKTLNQQMMGEIRQFMDDVYVKFENRKRYNQYINVLREMHQKKQEEIKKNAEAHSETETAAETVAETAPKIKIEEVE